MTLHHDLQHRANMKETRSFLRERIQIMRTLRSNMRFWGYAENMTPKVLGEDLLKSLPHGIMEALEDATNTN